MERTRVGAFADAFLWLRCGARRHEHARTRHSADNRVDDILAGKRKGWLEEVGRPYLRTHSMDLIAHALWTAAAAKTASRAGKPLRLRWAVFWGIFPDVFSFAIPAVVRIWWYIKESLPFIS